VDGDAVSVTFMGRRVYLKLDPATQELSEVAAPADCARSLLGAPIEVLLAESERRREASLLARSAALAAALEAEDGEQEEAQLIRSRPQLPPQQWPPVGRSPGARRGQPRGAWLTTSRGTCHHLKRLVAINQRINHCPFLS
jgi:hypothetical protein